MCVFSPHSFAMTERYLIMVEQPWVANSLKLLASKIQGLSFKVSSCTNYFRILVLSESHFFFSGLLGVAPDGEKQVPRRGEGEREAPEDFLRHQVPGSGCTLNH